MWTISTWISMHIISHIIDLFFWAHNNMRFLLLLSEEAVLTCFLPSTLRACTKNTKIKNYENWFPDFLSPFACHYNNYKNTHKSRYFYCIFRNYLFWFFRKCIKYAHSQFLARKHRCWTLWHFQRSILIVKKLFGKTLHFKLLQNSQKILIRHFYEFLFFFFLEQANKQMNLVTLFFTWCLF